MSGNLTRENLFDTVIDATVAGLKTTGFSTAVPWDKLVPKLKKVVGTTFEAGGHEALQALRKAINKLTLEGGKEGVFLAAGGGLTKEGEVPPDAVKRCAALKLLRHTYYHARRGNHRMWIVSLPDSYSQWPDRYLTGTYEEILTRLGASSERFSLEQRRQMAGATQQGLRWALKAQNPARRPERWFAGP